MKEDDPLEITLESMQEFLDMHGNFINGIDHWLMLMAEKLDVQAINHFQRSITILLTEAANRVERTAKENCLKNNKWN